MRGRRKEKILTDFRKNNVRSFTRQGSCPLPGPTTARAHTPWVLACPSKCNLAEGLLLRHLAEGSS